MLQMKPKLRSEVIQVIETRREVGTDAEGDPVRIVFEYWSFDGKLLAVQEPPLATAEAMRKVELASVNFEAVEG